MSVENYVPGPGPEKMDCPCGHAKCDKFGTPQRKTGHIRNCICARCTGGRSRRNGLQRQREFADVVGIKRQPRKETNEENWRAPFRFEVKSGAQVRPAVTAYLKAKKQADGNLAIGDARPFAAGFVCDGMALVVVEADAWGAFIQPLLEEAQ